MALRFPCGQCRRKVPKRYGRGRLCPDCFRASGRDPAKTATRDRCTVCGAVTGQVRCATCRAALAGARLGYSRRPHPELRDALVAAHAARVQGELVRLKIGRCANWHSGEGNADAETSEVPSA